MSSNGYHAPNVRMTALPEKTNKKLGLVIDLDSCVGCHACVSSCKEWNTAGVMAPLTDSRPYGDNPDGVWFNRVHSFEVEDRTVHFPKSCLHCDDAPCVTVCPTGASYKREEDGIVLVNPDTCIGCKLCSWACPYGAREFDQHEGVMKKCTLCVDRIYNSNLPPAARVPACVSACPTGARHFGDLNDPESDIVKLVEEREGFALMPEQECKPVNRYLPPKKKQMTQKPLPTEKKSAGGLLAHWKEKLANLRASSRNGTVPNQNHGTGGRDEAVK